MGHTIDIDTGGTYTDGFITLDDRFETVKVDTTPHDLTDCFMECIKEGAKRFKKEVPDLLNTTDAIRFSTTIGTNTFLEKTGIKIGVIVTKGFEGNLYKQKGENPLFDFIAKDMVIGITEEIGPEGEVVTPINEEEVLRVLKMLLEKGARMIVVSLRRSAAQPVHERKIRELVDRDYPKHYLGSVPLLLASEIATRSDAAARTNTALINAYLHHSLVKYLYKAEEDIRRKGYRHPLLVVHSTGGVTRVAKTTAVQTYNSGPVAGLYGSLEIAKLYGLKNVISLDVGGTSTDLGLIHNGQLEVSYKSGIQDIPLDFPMVKIETLGAGGGSIARIDPSKKIVVGPQSAGAMPGPVCYGLGGSEPTVTDSYLCLGYLNPDYYLGGQKVLDKKLALNAIESKLASPLGLTTEKVAFEIKEFIAREIGTQLSSLMKVKGLNPRDFTIFAFGGGGGCICCDVADRVGIPSVHLFLQSPVFCAFGSSMMDILHIYEDMHNIVLRSKSGRYLSDFEEYNLVIADLQQRSFRDMRGEGFKPENVNFILELEIKGNTKAEPSIIEYPSLFLHDKKDVLDLCGRYTDKVSGNSEIRIEVFRLKAMCTTPHYKFETSPTLGNDPQITLKYKKKVYWGKGYVETDIYERKLLKSGNIVRGPAVVEAEDTTYVIPQGKKYIVDQYLNGIIEEG